MNTLERVQQDIWCKTHDETDAYLNKNPTFFMYEKTQITSELEKLTQTESINFLPFITPKPFVE
jgi:hypothetical protein